MDISQGLRSDSARGHAQEARARKKAEAEQIGVNADYIAAYVDRFYGRVRTDDLLGPIFADRVKHWPAHLERMNSFWRSVLHNSGEFSGNPMLKHLLIPGLGAGEFARWLELFYATLRELETDPEATLLVGTRARMIADSLLTGIETHRNGPAGARAGKDLPMLLHGKEELNVVPATIVADQHETSGVQDGFQFPRWIWTSMLAAYALFFVAIMAATGRSGSALFAIVISIGYTVMFFAVATVIDGVKGRERPSPLAKRGGMLQTWTGPMSVKAVAVQVLTVPMCLVVFAVGILIARLVVFS